MLLTPHLFAGMLLGGFMPSAWLSPIAGVFSYFFLEMIPHWDPVSDKKRAMLIRAADFTISLFSLFAVTILKGMDPKYVLGGIFSGFTFFFFYLINTSDTDNKFLKKIIYLKKKITYTDKSAWGVLIQLSICVICLALMFNLVDFPTWDRIRTNFSNNFYH